MDKQVGAIVAMNCDRVIGKDGTIPWHYSQDLKRFKRLTLNSTIIMGRKTFESIGSKPLPQRRNVVISSQKIAGVECYNSLDEAITQQNGMIWIIGGAQIYQLGLHYCDFIDVTWVEDEIETTDCVRFPKLDDASWIAEAIKTNSLDTRLTHQRFTRK